MKPGWQIKTLGEVLQKTETINPQQYPEVEFEYIDVSSVSNSTFQIEETQTLKGKDAPSRARRLVRANDVLFATIRPTLRRIAIVPEYLDKQVCSTGYFVLRPDAEINHRFLFYWLFTENFIGAMEKLQKGASYPAVTDADVKAQKIPCPPLPEQQRIVGILDEAFAGIAKARANAERNLQNARSLFESHLNNVFTRRGEGWIERRLGDLVIFRNGINFTKSSRGETIKIVGVKDFQKNYWAPLDKLDTVVTDGPLPEADLLKENDILFVRSNGNMELIGRCLLIGTVTDRVTHSGFTIRARIDNSSVLPKYLCHFLKSNKARREMIDSGTGTNIKSLNQATLSELIIPHPPTSEQTRFVEQIERLADETQRLARLYEQKLEALDELKKSLLHQAFTGELGNKPQHAYV